MNCSEEPQSDSTVEQLGLGWLLVAFAVAVVGTAGSLWLSIGMGLKACPLCLYQRTFILAVVGILFVGLFSQARGTGLLNALALPAAMGGLGVAVFHEYLELTGKLECPSGVLGLGTAPQQSLAVFVVLIAVLVVPLLRQHRTSGLKMPAIGVVLGLLFALATIKSAPPMPAPPQEPYDAPLEMCRPPFHSANGEVNTR